MGRLTHSIFLQAPPAAERPSAHPSDEEIALFVEGGLQGEARQKVVRHALACPDCYELVAEVMRGQAPETSDAADVDWASDAERGVSSRRPTHRYALAAGVLALALAGGLLWSRLSPNERRVAEAPQPPPPAITTPSASILEPSAPPAPAPPPKVAERTPAPATQPSLAERTPAAPTQPEQPVRGAFVPYAPPSIAMVAVDDELAAILRQAAKPDQDQPNLAQALAAALKKQDVVMAPFTRLQLPPSMPKASKRLTQLRIEVKNGVAHLEVN